MGFKNLNAEVEGIFIFNTKCYLISGEQNSESILCLTLGSNLIFFSATNKTFFLL